MRRCQLAAQTDIPVVLSLETECEHGTTAVIAVPANTVLLEPSSMSVATEEKAAASEANVDHVQCKVVQESDQRLSWAGDTADVPLEVAADDDDTVDDAELHNQGSAAAQVCAPLSSAHPTSKRKSATLFNSSNDQVADSCSELVSCFHTGILEEILQNLSWGSLNLALKRLKSVYGATIAHIQLPIRGRSKIPTATLIKAVIEYVGKITDEGTKARAAQTTADNPSRTVEPLAKRLHVTAKATSGFLSEVVTVQVKWETRLCFTVTFRQQVLIIQKGRRTMTWRIDPVYLAVAGVSISTIVNEMLDDAFDSEALKLLDWICIERLMRQQSSESMAMGESPYTLDADECHQYNFSLDKIRASFSPLSLSGREFLSF